MGSKSATKFLTLLALASACNAARETTLGDAGIEALAQDTQTENADGRDPLPKPVATTCSWVVTTIAEKVEPSASIVIDSKGIPHAILVDAAGLSYLGLESGAWKSTPVTAVGSPQASLVMDATDHAHVLYNALPTGLGHASDASGAWRTEVIDASGGESGTSHGLAIDANGVLHAVYGKTVRHASNPGGVWSSEALPIPPNGFSDPAIAIDSSGALHVAQSPGAEAGGTSLFASVTYATNKSGSWNAFPIRGQSKPVIGPALASANDDDIYLVFKDSGASGGMPIRRVAVDGKDQDLVAPWTAFPSAGVSLALDKRGALHVAYITSNNPDSDPSRVEYMTNAVGAWQYCRVQVVGQIGALYEHGLGIAVDAANTPHIVFTDVQEPGTTRKAFYAALAR